MKPLLTLFSRWRIGQETNRIMSDMRASLSERIVGGRQKGQAPRYVLRRTGLKTTEVRRVARRLAAEEIEQLQRDCPHLVVDKFGRCENCFAYRLPGPD
jgi:hypothetical protein